MESLLVRLRLLLRILPWLCKILDLGLFTFGQMFTILWYGQSPKLNNVPAYQGRFFKAWDNPDQKGFLGSQRQGSKTHPTDGCYQERARLSLV
jgi:hypothetical protein